MHSVVHVQEKNYYLSNSIMTKNIDLIRFVLRYGTFVAECCYWCEAVRLQAWSSPEGSRKLRFPDFMTTQDGSKVVSLTHRPLYPQEILLVLISVRG